MAVTLAGVGWGLDVAGFRLCCMSSCDDLRMACVLTLRLSEGTPREDSVGCDVQGRAVDLGWE